MHWLTLISFFFGAACLTNAIPHLVSGLTGRRFPTLFSKPVGIGPSSPTVNFIWGWANLVFAYFLICRVGSFDVYNAADMVSAGAGSLVIGQSLARHFGKLASVSVT